MTPHRWFLEGFLIVCFCCSPAASFWLQGDEPAGSSEGRAGGQAGAVAAPTSSLDGTVVGGSWSGPVDFVQTTEDDPAVTDLLDIFLGPDAAKDSPFAMFVLGAESAPKDRFPYIVSLRRLNGGHYCGGVLIAPNKVLTAAHCVDTRNGNGGESFPTIWVGGVSRDAQSEYKVANSASVKIHPQWRGRVDMGFDVAIITLDRTMWKTTVAVASPRTRIPDKQDLIVAGWGYSGPRQRLEPVLKIGYVQAMSSGECGHRYREAVGRNFIGSSMLCAFSRTTDACRGDSGGPLIIPDPEGRPSKDIIVGVVSLGVGGCKVDGTPAIYANVMQLSSFLGPEATQAAWAAFVPNAPRNNRSPTLTTNRKFVPPSPASEPSPPVVQRKSIVSIVPTSGCHNKYEVRWQFGVCPYSMQTWSNQVQWQFLNLLRDGTGLTRDSIQTGVDWGFNSLDSCFCSIHTRVTVVMETYNFPEAQSLSSFVRDRSNLLSALTSRVTATNCADTVRISTGWAGQKCFNR
eukprot:CAMPEP_0117648418 /NCGR_PEP_ID=MMETSP0804-20121206/390_1 /TAXON_ID=1074897 /ORGANISM="Tetraselmis astigmatica, Strain CCMP880" /LENGTH=514 /DNA_ID=CAMNT_0005454011 /DNA_START=13 /DNA_END=1557 /DNA_ORIENTATION=-